jgi:hypothetical protein
MKMRRAKMEMVMAEYNTESMANPHYTWTNLTRLNKNDERA